MLRQMSYYPVHSASEAHIQNSVCFIEDEKLYVVRVEGGSLVHVLEETTWCAD